MDQRLFVPLFFSSLLFLAPGAQAQGTVNFSNRFIADSIDAPVTDTDGVTRLSGDAFLAQLYAGPSSASLAPVGPPIPFRTGTAAGYIDVVNHDSMRFIPTVAPGAKASVQMRVWAKAQGTTYEQALAKAGKTGASAILTLTTGGAGSPPSLAANLIGLKTFSLLSGIAPKITTQPANATVAVGSAATFSVVATGTAPLIYEWRKNGVSIAGKTTATLSLSNIQLSDAGTYSVVVRNEGGQVTSANVTLTVSALPQITLQPESISEKLGATVRFSTSATGSPAPTYQWQFNGANIAGATSASLTLAGVQAAQEGTYTVVARNSVGQVSSEPAVLLLTRPGGTVAFANRDIVSGIEAPVFDADGVTKLTGTGFLAQMYAGPSASTMAPVGPAVPFRVGPAAGYWLSEPQSTRYITTVVPGERAFIQARVWETARGRTFEAAVANASKLGNSEILSLITGGGGTPPAVPSSLTGLKSFKLLQGSAPKISTQPSSLAVNIGGPAVFKVVATGTDPLEYVWKFNNTKIDGATTATLTLQNAGAASAGSYTVEVVNLFGRVTSTPAVLTINAPPAITEQPVSLKIAAGATATFSTAAQGTLPLSYQWRLNGVDIPGATSRTFTRPGANAANEGAYSVLVSNPFGKTESESAVLLLTREGGTVIFANRDLNSGIDAKVLNVDNTPLQGEGYLAQLYAAPLGETLAAAGPAVPFRTGIAAGYWALDPEPTRYISTVQAGAKAQLQARVWEVAKGGSFEKAAAAGGNLGLSEVLTLTTGGAGNPPAFPTSLIGLKTFKLAPAVPPRIVKQPASLVVSAGATAVFEISATGTEPLSYRWRRNGTPIVSATGARLTIGPVAVSDAGAYSVEVSNPLGSVVSAAATLTVNAAPEIVVQPSSASVLLGSAAALSVEVAGSAPFTFQWRRNGKVITGATGPMLTLPNLQFQDEGTYDVRVQNAFGQVLSDPAVLLIPRSGGTLVFVNREIGSGIDAPVTDVDGVTRLSGRTFLAQLYSGKSEAELAPTGPAVPFRTDIAAGYWSTLPSSSREIPGVSPGEAAFVQARVWEAAKGSSFEEALANQGKVGLSLVLQLRTGGAGAPPSFPTSLVGLKPFKLIIGEPPKIVSEPSGLIRKQGESGSFKVSASGTSPLAYQWQLNEVDIPGANQASLELTSLTILHAGAYRVRVSNGLGVIHSKSVTLDVLSPPEIVSGPSGVSAGLNESVEFSVTATGTSPLQYQWLFNGALIAGATRNVYTIPAAAASHQGTYTVTVSNAFGADSSDGAVLLLTLPGATVGFANRVVGLFDAPIYASDGSTRLSGAGFLAQLYAGDSANTLGPVGPAVPFRTGIAAGYWSGDPNPVRFLPNIVPGDKAALQVRVWPAQFGTSFESALAAGAEVGASEVLVITTGGAGNPPSFPAPLEGLKSFSLAKGVPPKILAQPTSATTAIGKSVSFKVTAEGSTPLRFQWRRNGVDILGATRSELGFSSVTQAEAGSYDVVVTNPLGSVTSAPATLAIQETLLSGVVQDGYITRGTVFLDLNRNGLLDPLEPSTVTDDQGRFSLGVDLSVHDANKNGKLDFNEGVLVVRGGIDVSTGLPLVGSLQAPGDATVITPLTTLVQKLVDQNPALTAVAAESAVKAAFSIPASVNLSTFDPIIASASGDAASSKVLGAAAKVQDTVTQIAALLGAASTQSENDVADSVTDVIAQTILKSGAAELTKSSNLESVIQATAALDGIKVDQGLVAGAAAIIADGNLLKDQFVSSGGTATFIATEIARVQGVVQGTVSDRLAEAAGGGSSIEDAVALSTGPALANLVVAAPVGDITGTDARPGAFSLASSSFSIGETPSGFPSALVIRADGNRGQVSVDISFRDVTASSDAGDYRSSPLRITFLDGEISKSIDWSAVILHDTLAEANETFTLSLSLAPGSPAGAGLGLASAVVEILDDDSIGKFSFSSASVEVGESGSVLKPFLITRTGGSSGQITLVLTPRELSGGAKPGLDFDPAPVLITFASGQASKAVVLPVLEDRALEKDESFGLTLSLAPNSSDGATIGPIAQCTVVIKDNEFIFAAPKLTQTGLIQIEAFGEPNREYGIEASDDLVRWVSAGNKRTDAQGRLVFSELILGTNERFYRARVTP